MNVTGRVQVSESQVQRFWVQKFKVSSLDSIELGSGGLLSSVLRRTCLFLLFSNL